MSGLDGTCDVCKGESGGKFVGVAAIPGAPMSVAWCLNCLKASAVPEFIAEFRFFDIAGGDLAGLAPWVFETSVWKNGEYLPFRAWAESFTPEEKEAELAGIREREQELEELEREGHEGDARA